MSKMLRYMLGFGCLMLSSAGLGRASSITVFAHNSGTWTTASTNINGSRIYIAGRGESTNYANFFLFDLSGVSGTILSATLRLNVLGINSSGDYTVFDVSTPTSQLLQLVNNPDVGIYSDLSSGVAYGSVSLNTSLIDQFVSITLNSAGIADLQSRIGQNNVALGGGYVPVTQYGYAFGSGGFPETQGDLRQLILETTSDVPEPSAIVLFGSGLTTLAVLARRKRRF